MSAYTKLHLEDVPDSAQGFGMPAGMTVRFATQGLEGERTGLSLHRLPPGGGHPFLHRHEGAEEVYVVLSGSGTATVGDETVELGRLDALRVAPDVLRSFDAGPEGLELLAFGEREEGGEVVPLEGRAQPSPS